jgi:hypothetical protein
VSIVLIIDHDIEEEDHHHGLAAVRGQSFDVAETGGRSRPRSFVSSGIIVVIVIIAMCALPLELAGWTGFLASSWNDKTVLLIAIRRRRGDRS